MESPISVLIVEDEEIWSLQIEKYLQDFGFDLAGKAETIDEALPLLNENKFDIALLDININGRKNGIELGKMIRNVYQKPFIFITAGYEDEAREQAIAAGPSGYLLKPVNATSLFVTIQNAIQNFTERKQTTGKETQDSFFFVKHGNKYKRINWADVICLTAEKNYVQGVTKLDKEEFFLRSSLVKVLTKMLPTELQNDFVQINRSEVINIHFIEELTNELVKTPRGNFSITDTYVKAVRQRLNILS